MTTEEDCIDALREAAQILGRSPTKAEYEDLDITPSASTILRHCGGWNDAKEQAGLETNFSRGKRVQDKPDDVELPDGMEWEELSQDQRWHYKNREWNTERSLQRRQDLRRWINSIKADSDGCTYCSESDPVCLDFHHCDGTDKEMAVNKMVPYGYSRADIRAEIDKCDLVCANCHWKIHNGEETSEDGGDYITGGCSPSSIAGVNVTTVEPSALLDAEAWDLTKEQRLRAWSWAYKHDRGCCRCGETTPACLQFHHPDETEKTRGVGAMIFECYPANQVIAEARACVVLCANCHRREHHDGFAPREDGKR